ILSVLDMPMILFGIFFICFSDKPTNTITSSFFKLLLISRKYFKPFLASQRFATPKIINLFSKLLSILKLLLMGLKISKSIPLLITLTGYSLKKDFFTKLASQFEGVTIVKFFIPVNASFFLLKLSLELFKNQLAGYSFFWIHFSFLSTLQHSHPAYSKYEQ